ncbi:MOB kinase activator-like 3 isoform X3 [Drosophila subobscura]|uniref:MOB kinase activator-like 3 isoform X3 n=1 Tax=Drosophila subobscura TaxID=7241 RepID=UPI00155B3FAB|nr:MOB kinase activator-like 3 isoform X3 [Drosophila subobscura]
MALNGFVEFFQKGKTFRPKKRFAAGTIRYSLYKQAQASLQSGINLRQVVRLPAGENMNDWLAVHVVDFFNRINLIYGTVSEFCDESTCPTMSGGSRYEYLWADGDLCSISKNICCTLSQNFNAIIPCFCTRIHSPF